MLLSPGSQEIYSPGELLGRHTSNNSIRKATIGARKAVERIRSFIEKINHLWSSWGIIIITASRHLAKYFAGNIQNSFIWFQFYRGSKYWWWAEMSWGVRWLCGSRRRALQTKSMNQCTRVEFARWVHPGELLRVQSGWLIWAWRRVMGRFGEGVGRGQITRAVNIRVRSLYFI